MTILRAVNITKRYPGVTALNSVTIQVEPGEVHCIVGENGAGKSTLVKVLTGLERPEEGHLEIGGRDMTGQTSKALAYVPQELNLFNDMSVAENIFLPFGRGATSSVVFNRRRCENDAQSIIKELQIEASPADLVRNISVAEQQLVQIARALVGSEFKLLILDEPTASLTTPEIDRLFEVIAELKRQRKSVIFITHKLDEVTRLQDAVTVLRNGEMVGSARGEKVSEDWLVRKMSGKGIDLTFPYRPTKPVGDVLLEVEGLSGPRFSEVSFTLSEGEVLGFAGLVGAGRSEIMQTIFGYLPRTAGEIRFQGRPWTYGSPKASIDRGLIYLSEERKSHGIFPYLEVSANVGIGLLKSLSRLGVVNSRKERASGRQVISDYRVKAPSEDTKIGNLSGGNQQKVLIGRSLMAGPRVLFLDEPTRGIDVNAKEEIYALIQRIAEDERMGIVLISSELEELLRCSNRVIAVYAGQVGKEIPEEELNMDNVLSAIIGIGDSLSGPAEKGIA